MVGIRAEEEGKGVRLLREDKMSVRHQGEVSIQTLTLLRSFTLHTCK